jgi:hypothetical protein
MIWGPQVPEKNLVRVDDLLTGEIPSHQIVTPGLDFCGVSKESGSVRWILPSQTKMGKEA